MVAKNDSDVWSRFDRRVTGAGAPADLPFEVHFDTHIEFQPSEFSAAGSAARTSRSAFESWLSGAGDTPRWNTYNARTSDEKDAAVFLASKL